MKIPAQTSNLAASLALAVAALAAAPVAARAGGHDGTWAVELVTDSGLCGAHHSYAVAVRGGQVRPIAGAGGAEVGGRVAPDGTVGLTVSGGGATGSGTGRLSAGAGAGTWRVSGLCSGRWTARRGGTRTARAE